MNKNNTQGRTLGEQMGSEAKRAMKEKARVLFEASIVDAATRMAQTGLTHKALGILSVYERKYPHNKSVKIEEAKASCLSSLDAAKKRREQLRLLEAAKAEARARVKARAEAQGVSRQGVPFVAKLPKEWQSTEAI